MEAKWRDFVAGGLAGVISRTAISPIDVLKIRLQVLESADGVSLPRHLKDLLRTEGVKVLWKGNVAGVLLYSSYSSIQFGVLEVLKNTTSDSRPFIHGGISALIATTLTYPLDILRTRMTLASLKGPFLLHYGNKGFLRSYFNGYTLTVCQVVPYMGCIFGVHHLLKNRFDASDFTAGAFAGLISKTAFMPVDVLRRRLQILQSDPREICLKPEKLRYLQNTVGLRNLALRMWKVEGPKAFFRGWSMAIIKSTPATAISFASYNFIRNHLTGV